MSKPFGYSVSAYDNNTDMFDSDDARLARCPLCGCRLDFFATNPDYALTKRFKPAYMDVTIRPGDPISVTYDGARIVTRQFKEFCMEQNYAGLSFIPFSKDPEHFHLLVETVVKCHIEPNRPRFLDLCPECGNYVTIVSPPDRFEIAEPLADGLYRSDLLFASGDAKHPLLLISPETKEKFKAAKFRKLSYDPIYGV